jgi:beta-lactamase superfamily II metal-dependent hydrolase
VYEADFLAVEADGVPSSRSGDAIAVRFTSASDGRQRVIVIDAGFTSVGADVVRHIKTHYSTTIVDLVISTHPDADHLNGLRTVVEELQVRELMVHMPRAHAASVVDFANLEALDGLIDAARRRGVPITEPFEGVTRFSGELRILGPSQEFYEEKLKLHLEEEATGQGAAARALHATKSFALAARDLLTGTLSGFPAETLGEDGDTSARNDASVITLLSVDGDRLLFTGDAGIEGLGRAADSYERNLGAFHDWPLKLLQVPHHGSRINLSPSLLNRVVGPPGAPHAATEAIVSSAKADPKHPSPRVTNALGRRGIPVVATEGRGICIFSGDVRRQGWFPVEPIGPLAESEDV